jgi:hypothetical protein
VSELGPDEQILTSDEIALEDAENDDWPRARAFKEDGHLAADERRDSPCRP